MGGCKGWGGRGENQKWRRENVFTNNTILWSSVIDFDFILITVVVVGLLFHTNLYLFFNFLTFETYFDVLNLPSLHHWKSG